MSDDPHTEPTMLPETMLALRGHRRGGPEELVVESAPRPVAGPGDVLIAVDAAAITNGELDWELSWEDLDGADRTPVIPSHELAGRVIALGSDVDDLAVDEAVFGMIPFHLNGAAAEYAVAPADAVAPAPEALDPASAAALPLAALTAWQALVDHGRLAADQHVLIHGGGGGVGAYAVQIARSLCASVTTTAATSEVEFVRSLGADRVIDFQQQSFEDEVSGVDIVLDTVGGDTLRRSWPVLRPGGRLITLGAPPDAAMAERYGVDGIFFVVTPDRPQLIHLAAMVADESLRPIVSQTFPLTEGRAAYESLSSPRPPGKTVLLTSSLTTQGDHR